MRLLEALLLLAGVIFLMLDPEQVEIPPATAPDLLDRQAIDRRAGRAERHLHQLTDQAVLAMLAEVRRQVPGGRP